MIARPVTHPLRIAFLCPRLSPGADGVGDYTRRLACALAADGVHSRIIAWNDLESGDAVEETQGSDGHTVPVLRLSRTQPTSIRGRHLAHALRSFSPDWVSVQMVNFGFGHRGFIGPLIAQLRPLGPHYRWHVMSHELWLGLERSASSKFRLWGMLQRRQFKRCLKTLRPGVVHTHAAPYQAALKALGFPARHLPLFSNFPATTAPNRPVNQDLLTVLVFGSLHPEWNPVPALQSLLIQRPRTQIQFVLAGHNGPHADRLCATLSPILGPRLQLERTGGLAATLMAARIARADIALATLPWAIWEKSSSIATTLESGTPTVVIRDDWVPCQPTPTEFQRPHPPHLHRWHPELDWDLVLRSRIEPTNAALTRTKQIFWADLILAQGEGSSP